MAQQYKIDKVQCLKEKFDGSQSYIFSDYSGLSVGKITELRNELKKTKSQFMVAKNNFIKRVVAEKEMPDFGEILAGPTAVTFVEKDVNATLKVLFSFAKNSSLTVKGGWTEGKIFDDKTLESLSKLPGRDELIAMLMATLNAPLQNFVYACKDVTGRLVRVLNSISKVKK